MKMKKQWLASAALVVAGALALSGCTGGGAGAPPPAGGKIDTSGELSGTIKFQTWSLKNEKFTPYFNDLIASFTAEHPKVKVEWIDQPGDGYQEKVLSQANSNALPDVINLPNDIAYPLASTGKLLDLSAADPKLASEYVTGAWDSYKYPGVTGSFGLPWYLGTDLSWWNGTELAKYGVDTANLPNTIEDQFKLAKTVGQKSKGTLPLLSSMPTIELFASRDIPILNATGEFTFNTPEAAKILSDYKSAYDAGALPAEALTGDYGGNADMFKQGKVGFTTAGSGFAADLQKDAPSIAKSTIATPRIGVAPLFIQGLTVSADSPNKAAALAFATYVTNTKNQVAFCKLASGFMPGTKAGSADYEGLTASITDPLQKNAMKIVSEAMKSAKPLTPVQWTSNMKKYMDQQMALALKGEIDSKSALDKIVKYANENRVK